jgi:RHS repeat-associated protein
MDDPIGTGVSTYAYNAQKGRLISRTDAQTGVVAGLTYEADTGRLDAMTYKIGTAAPFSSFDLDYDKASNVTQKISDVFTNGSDGTWTYQHDPASRLTKATLVPTTGQTTMLDYAYDGAGNRTLAKRTVGGTVNQDWTTTYNAASLPTTATNAVGGEVITYGYDAAGITLTAADSSINANDWAYTYDAFSRLSCAQPAVTTCASSGTARITYVPDAFSRTHTRTNAGTTATLSYRGIGEQLAKTVAGSTTTYALTAGGSPFAQKVGNTKSYFLRDAHGDSVGLINSSGSNVGTTSFDPWGQVLSVSGTQPALGFQSDYTDAVTKQVDMGTRWYAPGQGRFTTRDVLFGDPLHPISLNQWVYGAANPVTMWDPTGMGPCDPSEGRCVHTRFGSSTDENTTVAEAYDAYSTWEASSDWDPPPPPPPPPPPHSPVLIAHRSSLAEDADWLADAELGKQQVDEAACHGLLGCLGHAASWVGDKAADGAGAAINFVGEHAQEIKTTLAVGAGVFCIVATAGTCGLAVAGTLFAVQTSLDFVALGTGHIDGAEFGRNTLFNAGMSAMMGIPTGFIDKGVLASRAGQMFGGPIGRPLEVGLKTYGGLPGIACDLNCRL